ncbi:MAG: hypothetical protein ACK4GQ_05945, partial [Candidatus Hadarchaeales archaeon]
MAGDLGERGISPVVGAMLVISMVVAAMGIYVQQITPAWNRKNESEHFFTVRSALLKLQTLLLNRESGEIDLKMSADPAPIFSFAPLSSRMEISAAPWVKRFQPVEDAFVSQASPATNYGGNGTLMVRSFKPPAGTSANAWTLLKFDPYTELPGISADQIIEAWVVLYCENLAQFRVIPWG